MRKSASFLVLVLFFALGLVEVRAQSDDKKFEVGGQFSALRVATETVTATGPAFALKANGDTIYGFGGRFGYRLSKYFTLEAEGNFFPRDGVLDAGQKTEGFFGVKAGKRYEKVGVFAKVRPGVVHYSRGDYRFIGACVAIFPQPIGCYQPEASTNFAADVGGVFEYYPTKRTIIRFDGGDTIVRLPASNVAAFQTNATSIFSLVVVSTGASTRHQFQSSVGFGFRF